MHVRNTCAFILNGVECFVGIEVRGVVKVYSTFHLQLFARFSVINFIVGRLQRLKYLNYCNYYDYFTCNSFLLSVTYVCAFNFCFMVLLKTNFHQTFHLNCNIFVWKFDFLFVLLEIMRRCNTILYYFQIPKFPKENNALLCVGAIHYILYI